MDIVTIVLLIMISWLGHIIIAQRFADRKREAKLVAGYEAQKPRQKRIPNDFLFDCDLPYHFDD